MPLTAEAGQTPQFREKRRFFFDSECIVQGSREWKEAGARVVVGSGLANQRLYRGVVHQVERLESPAHGVEFGVFYFVIAQATSSSSMAAACATDTASSGLVEAAACCRTSCLSFSNIARNALQGPGFSPRGGRPRYHGDGARIGGVDGYRWVPHLFPLFLHFSFILMLHAFMMPQLGPR